jgi:quinol monooxygenase YgiN
MWCFSQNAFPKLVQNENYIMKNLGLLATLHAKPEQAATVAAFIKGAVELAEKEKKTLTWYSFRIDETTFGIFDTFQDESGRQAHLDGEIAKALMGKADELLSQAPDIKKIDILSAK